MVYKSANLHKIWIWRDNCSKGPKIHGRCYRCLALEHRVVQCREPVRCWKCKKFSHIALHCSRGRVSSKLGSRVTLSPSSGHHSVSKPGNPSFANPTHNEEKGKSSSTFDPSTLPPQGMDRRRVLDAVVGAWERDSRQGSQD
jgi:hypothetical protein